MTALLNWRVWAAIVLAAGLAFTHFTAYKSGRAVVRAAWDAERLEQSEALRRDEKARTIANQGVDRDHQIEKARLVSVARAADGKLREFIAELNRPVVDSAPLGGADDPRDAIIDQCATALVGMDGEAKSLALKATSLQRYASKVCVTKPATAQ